MWFRGGEAEKVVLTYKCNWSCALIETKVNTSVFLVRWLTFALKTTSSDACFFALLISWIDRASLVFVSIFNLVIINDRLSLVLLIFVTIIKIIDWSGIIDISRISVIAWLSRLFIFFLLINICCCVSRLVILDLVVGWIGWLGLFVWLSRVGHDSQICKSFIDVLV